MDKPIISPSIFNAYHICRREAWLMYHQLTGEQENPYLEIGRLINFESYKREKKEIYLFTEKAIIDMIMHKSGMIFVAEIKKSSRKKESSILQLKYYLYILYNRGYRIKGKLKIPKERKSIDVDLTEDDILYIEDKKIEISKYLCNNKPEKSKYKKECSACSYLDFCWA